MTFEQAQERLEKLANGTYHSVAQEVVKFPNTGFSEVKYSVYINGLDWCHGKTWEEAFSLLEARISAKK